MLLITSPHHINTIFGINNKRANVVMMYGYMTMIVQLVKWIVNSVPSVVIYHY
jgi:competence protein ComGF